MPGDQGPPPPFLPKGHGKAGIEAAEERAVRLRRGGRPEIPKGGAQRAAA